MIDNQVRDLRKRQAIESFKAGESDKNHRLGTYWGIRSHIADYELSSGLDFPPDLAQELAKTKTRLKRLDKNRQQQLVNWGYAICDTAMRRWVSKEAAKPENLPYPEAA